MKTNHSFDQKSGAQDMIEAISKDLKGKIKEAAGKAVGNPHLEARGDIDQVEAKAQNEVGRIKRSVGR
jgi:uncharacterized protein YjbJ (UPF0337 family)